MKKPDLVMVAIDESCPICEHPEIAGVLDLANNTVITYVCNQEDCVWASKERPDDENN